MNTILLVGFENSGVLFLNLDTIQECTAFYLKHGQQFYALNSPLITKFWRALEDSNL